ncbi:hypothetical protein [Paenibacillus cymbidii]|uniref:hypothetical protein n=1 Tax=Paenibacillus cymbidii TaxID=1639034 RepID=UPI0010819D0D|nr:hypothetical protein [Paenibacillus cymbidii]
MLTKRLSGTLFGVGAAATLVVFLLLMRSVGDPGHGWVSMLAVVFAEAAVYGSFASVGKARQARDTLPAYLPLVIVSALYGAAALFHTVVFWLLLKLSFPVYVWIHAATWIVWAIAATTCYRMAGYISAQERRTANRTQPIKQLQQRLRTIRNHLERDAASSTVGLLADIGQLQDQLAYSDPFSHPSLSALEASMQWQAEELERCAEQIARNGPDEGSIALCRSLVADIAADLAKRSKQVATDE